MAAQDDSGSEGVGMATLAFTPRGTRFAFRGVSGERSQRWEPKEKACAPAMRYALVAGRGRGMNIFHNANYVHRKEYRAGDESLP